MKYKALVIIFYLLTYSRIIKSAEINIAVASNFSSTISKIIKQFELINDCKVNLILGSSGKLYAQIIHGAPYDIFLSADKYRVEQLIKNGISSNKNRLTYAKGTLVLFSLNLNFNHFSENKFNKLRRIAIANPIIAPYGLAAKQYLQFLNQWEKIQESLIFGENISQAFQFAVTENVDIAIVSLAQVLELNIKQKNYFIISNHKYNPIEQDAILISKKLMAEKFFNYLKNEQVKKLIESNGYKVVR